MRPINATAPQNRDNIYLSHNVTLLQIHNILHNSLVYQHHIVKNSHQIMTPFNYFSLPTKPNSPVILISISCKSFDLEEFAKFIFKRRILLRSYQKKDLIQLESWFMQILRRAAANLFHYTDFRLSYILWPMKISLYQGLLTSFDSYLEIKKENSFKDYFTYMTYYMHGKKACAISYKYIPQTISHYTNFCFS